VCCFVTRLPAIPIKVFSILFCEFPLTDVIRPRACSMGRCSQVDPKGDLVTEPCHPERGGKTTPEPCKTQGGRQPIEG
jgi:hypothetical protein